MSLLLSWIGTADFTAWKRDREEGDGPLLAVARHVRATEVEVLWDDGSKKVPFAEAPDYRAWLEGRLRDTGLEAQVRIRPCSNARVMDFAWVYGQLEELLDDLHLSSGHACVNASSGTWVMSACWIVLKKACGLDLRLFRSSLEMGVEEVELPPNLTIEMTEVLKGRRSPLFDRYVRGDIRLGRPDIEGMIGDSQCMKEVFLELSLVAPFTDVPVLLLGPPGVGKTRLAEQIHKRSGATGRFVTVECGMLGDKQSLAELWGWEAGAFTDAKSKKAGLIETAANGTLFLDEIGNADALTQQNLLRLLQNKKYRPLGSNEEKEIEIRIIAATNRDLREEVRNRRFREDLLDRLSVYLMEIPPLRRRPEDIGPLAREFLRRFYSDWGRELRKLGGEQKVLSVSAERELKRFDWPGNVRQLENTMIRLAVRTISSKTEITAEDVRRELSIGTTALQDATGLPPLEDGFDLESVLDPIRFHYLKDAWIKSQGNKSKMAPMLGFKSRTPLKNLIERLRNVGYDVDGLR
jgi:DNA-binding NtrC family response regulator